MPSALSLNLFKSGASSGSSHATLKAGAIQNQKLMACIERGMIAIAGHMPIGTWIGTDAVFHTSGSNAANTTTLDDNAKLAAQELLIDD